MAPRTNAVTVTAVLVTLAAIAARLPAGARASAIRVAVDDDGVRRSAALVDAWPAAAETVAASDGSVAASAAAAAAVVREKRTLLKLKPLIVLPAKLAVGAGAKLVAGAKLGVKAVELGSKALGVGVVGLKAVKKVAKVTVKAATALGVKAVLLNFLFQKVNQVIDFKTRLLGNLDQRNRQQNAQFLSPVPKTTSIGNKEDDDFLASSPGDQQVLAQEQSKTSAAVPSATSVAPLVDDDEVTFDANKISLQVPDRLFGPSFTAVNGISVAIGNVIQNTATRLARLVDAIKASIWRKASGVSTISNSSGSFSENGATATATGTRGSRDTASDVADDGLERDPLDEVAPAEKRAVDAAAITATPPSHRRR